MSDHTGEKSNGRTTPSPVDFRPNSFAAGASFALRRACDAFFADAAYKDVRARHFDAAVNGFTEVASYVR